MTHLVSARGVVAALALLAVPATAQLDDSMAVLRASGDSLLSSFATALSSPSGAVAPPSPLLFDLVPDSGPTNLSATSLTVNSSTLTTRARYLPSGISGTTWTGTGPTLTQSGSGTAPALITSPFTDGSTAVSFGPGQQAGQVYTSEGGASPTMTTEDMVIHLVIRHPWTAPAASRAIVGNLSSTTGSGWGVFLSTGNSVQVSFDDDTVGACFFTSYTGTAGSWEDVQIFYDRSVGVRVYRNGALASSHACTTAQGSLDQAAKTLAIGAYDALPLGGAMSVALVDVQTCAGCISTTAEQDTIALNRASRVLGVFADVAVGSAVPTTMTRTSTAYTDTIDVSTGVRSLHLVGTNAVRAARRKELAGGEFITGYLAEPAATNIALQSQTFQTTWATLEATVSADSIAAPDGSLTADGIVASAVSGVHQVSQTITTTAVSTTFSAWAKAGNRSFVTLKVSSPAVEQTFSLAACTLGTNAFGAQTPTVESWGNGWCRVAMTYTGAAGSSSHQIRASGTTADGAYSGDASTVSVSVSGAQVETGAIASSYIATTTATVTRSADVLAFAAGANAPSAGGTIEVEFLVPDFDNPAVLYVAGIVGSSNNDDRSPRIASNDRPSFTVTSAGATQANVEATSGNASDGERHTIRGIWDTNDVRAFYDGVSIGTPDTVASLPVVTTSITIGRSNAGNEAVGLISRVRVWNTTVLP